ncbi:transducin-like enhancer protein 1 [Dinothrombium tinctorium]|uniref:Transducin-like enhancer protein 1 n=1 Tax=Dinothrombium tinctorium TaxID=1965070 RepID=A0A443RMX8_9ACAR|nr:transducin-like enhancer protein 1 [Dinothrombium tinctorium]
MYPTRHPVSGPPQAGQPFKFTVNETLERIKEEFNFLQAQYHSLKLELDKLATEKTEMQRHYVMTEIAKRLNAIIAQILPFLSQEHQQQVAAAVERAKQVTMTELNAIIGQQMHAQQLPPHAHGPLPMMPHAAASAMAAGLQPPMPPSTAAGLLALSSSVGAGGPAPHMPGVPPVTLSSSGSLKDHRADEKRSNSGNRTASSDSDCDTNSAAFSLLIFRCLHDSLGRVFVFTVLIACNYGNAT